MSGLVVFLRAQLAEDEQVAKACGHVRRTWDGPYAMEDQCLGEVDHREAHGPWLMLKPSPSQTYRPMTEPERRPW